MRCIGHGESHNGADPNADGNLFGMLDGWAASHAGTTLDGYASQYYGPRYASPSEQLYRAWVLYNMDGWSPWSTAPGCGL